MISDKNLSTAHPSCDLDTASSPRAKWFNLREFFISSGTSLLICFAFLDPGNLDSILSAANLRGYQLMWILLWSHVLGLLIQNLSARLGLKSEQGLAGLIRDKYNRKMSLFVWLNIETAIIGCDILEIFGTCYALKVLFGIDLDTGVAITILGTGFVLLLTHYGMRTIECFFATSLAAMAVCFAVEAGLSTPSFAEAMEGIVIPSLPFGDTEALLGASAMIGAIIMPHNIFLHSSLISKKHQKPKISSISLERLKNYFLLESIITTTISLFTNFFICMAFAEVFYIRHDRRPTLGVNFQNAEKGLYEVLGNSQTAKIVWGIGLLAAGQSSTITGTIAGQLVIDGFFEVKIKPWVRALVSRSIALIPSAIVAFFFKEKIDIVFKCVNVFQSFTLPLTLVPLILLTCDKRIMGNLANTRTATIAYSTIVLLIVGVNAITVYQAFIGAADVLKAIIITAVVVYTSFVIFLYRNYE